MGDRMQYLSAALDRIDRHTKMELIRRSSFYETVPVGYEDQATFINLCVEILTALSPMQLLRELQKIETDLNRKREIRWGPRTLDIDILLYDEVESSGSILTIPHAQMTRRQFVLVPLAEIAPGLRIKGHPVEHYLDRLEDQGVRKIDHDE